MNIKKARYCYAILIAVFSVVTQAVADLKPLQNWMEALVEDGKVVGCMAQVTQDGKTIFLEAR